MFEETTGVFLGATLALTAYAVFAVAFYQTLHTRDAGLARVRARLQRAGLDPDRYRLFDRLWRFIAIPTMTCLFAAVIAVLNVGVTQDREVEDIYAISAALVAAVRILSYTWQEPARELAKMIPIALLSIALFNASDLDLAGWRSGLEEAGTENVTVYVIALVGIEWSLRLAYIKFGQTKVAVPTSA